jgi:TRAP-type C4-dicarboxylate transport system substrate-binding protein
MRRKKINLTFSGVAAAAAAALLIATIPAAAQDKTFDLKISSWVPASHPLQKAYEDWAASITKASNGTLKFQIFPSEQLGKAFDHYDMARDGIADVAYVSPGYQPGRFPIIDAGALPFMLANKNGIVALDQWYRKYAPKEMSDVKYCFAFIHDPGDFHSRTKKIVVPDDIKGMKIRPAHAVMASLITKLGGTNIQASAPQVRDVIEKGVADAVTFPWGSIVLFGIDKVTKYHMIAGLYATPFVNIINMDKFNQMSAAQKKVIDDHCTTEWAAKFAGPWADFEHDGIAKIKAEPGQEVYQLTNDQLGLWKKAAEPLTGEWIANVKKKGLDGEAAMKEFNDIIAKNKAGS